MNGKAIATEDFVKRAQMLSELRKNGVSTDAAAHLMGGSSETNAKVIHVVYWWRVCLEELKKLKKSFLFAG